MLLARTQGDAAALSTDIRRELRRMEPDIFFFLQGDTLRETAAVTMLPFRVAASVASAAGVVALALGAIGLYGVVAYMVTRRTRELAIRAALGARSGALLRLALATGSRVVTLGVVVGAVLAFVVSRVVARAAGGIPPDDPLVWAGALLLVIGVAAAAHIGPARPRRETRPDPGAAGGVESRGAGGHVDGPRSCGVGVLLLIAGVVAVAHLRPARPDHKARPDASAAPVAERQRGIDNLRRPPTQRVLALRLQPLHPRG